MNKNIFILLIAAALSTSCTTKESDPISTEAQEENLDSPTTPKIITGKTGNDTIIRVVEVPRDTHDFDDYMGKRGTLATAVSYFFSNCAKNSNLGIVIDHCNITDEKFVFTLESHDAFCDNATITIDTHPSAIMREDIKNLMPQIKTIMDIASKHGYVILSLMFTDDSKVLITYDSSPNH